MLAARSVVSVLPIALVLAASACTSKEPPPTPAPRTTPSAPPEPSASSAPEADTRSQGLDRNRLGPLSVQWRGGLDGEGRGEGPVVVLLHGYGTRSDDLANMTRAMRLPAAVRYVLPEAPVELEGGGRAWWRIGAEDEAAVAEGTPRDLSGGMPAGMVIARERMAAMLRALRNLPDVAPDQVAVVGFSQGAMVAMDVALFTEPKVRGVGVLAGTLVAAEAWRDRYPLRQGMPVFVAHGRDDARLPFAMAEKLRDALTEGGLDVTWVAFEGGHALPLPVLQSLSEFLVGAFELAPSAEDLAGPGAEGSGPGE